LGLMREEKMTDFIRFVPENHRSPIVRQEQLEVVFQALHRHFPHEVSWGQSSEDASLRVTLPEGVSARELSEWARQEKVIFSFDPEAKGQAHKSGAEGAGDAMYLYWSHLEQAEVEEGISRLGKLIVRYMDRADGSSPHCFIGP
jgi:DNA-binding transcriptional MocR family regulator